MNRRDFVRAAAVAAAAGAHALAADKQADAKAGEPERRLAPPCGLYCGICLDHVNGKCHGCGCGCGKCAGSHHARGCPISKCAKGKGIESCATCKDLPCTRVIQFTCNPIWRTHAPCIENLRRRKAIGTDAWLAEQKAHWSDPQARKAWLALYAECGRKAAEFRKSQGK